MFQIFCSAAIIGPTPVTFMPTLLASTVIARFPSGAGQYCRFGLQKATIVNINGISKHIDINLDEGERHKLRDSAENLKKIIGELDL